jgi:hypothetical protein
MRSDRLVSALFVAGVVACAVPVPCAAQEQGGVAADETGKAAAGDPRKAAEAELLWRKANQWLGSSREEAGRYLMEDIRRDYPDTEWGTRAGQWLDVNRGIDRSGRAEFIVGGTYNGALLGFALASGLSDYTHPYEGEVIAWSAVGGAVLGLTGTAISSGFMDVSESQAWVFDTMGLWGFWNGIVFYDLVRPLDSEEVLLAGAAGLTLGTAATLAFWDDLNVDEGAIKMSTWAGIYTAESALLTIYAIGGDRVLRDQESLALLALVVPANAALVGGYYTGRTLQWTADDVTYIALGGFVGNLLGFALVATIDALQGVRAGCATMLASTLASLGVSTLIVAPWENAGSTASASAAPGALLVAGREGVRLSLPVPEVTPVEYRGELGLAVGVPLLSIDL